MIFFIKKIPPPHTESLFTPLCMYTSVLCEVFPQPPGREGNMRIINKGYKEDREMIVFIDFRERNSNNYYEHG